MKLYLNCYVVGEGYTLKRAVWPDVPQLEEISRQQFPEPERNIFIGTDAPHLFLGTIDGIRFGCVRNLETGMNDENGRRCFFHIAVEAAGVEAEWVDNLLMFALASRSRFAAMCVKTIVYKDGDYQLAPENFAELLKAANSYASQVIPVGILVPENMPEGFFKNSGIVPKDIEKVITFDEWKSRETFPLELFLYCSTPASGFTLSQINPISGAKMKFGKEAHANLLPYAQVILNSSGASMALFEQSNRICFIGKGIQSTTADHYGRKKKMSVVLQTSKTHELQIRQFAAWALLDYDAFSSQLTDCVSVYDGPRGFEVSGEKISQLLGQFAKKIVFPEGNRCKQGWHKVLGARGQHPFYYFVAEASLDYFCRIAQIDLTENDIDWFISQAEFEYLRTAPANLEFKLELYEKSEKGEVDATPMIMEVEKIPVAVDAVAAKPVDTNAETKSAPAEQKIEPQATPAIQKMVKQNTGFTTLPEEQKPQQWDSRGDPAEYIDLLKTKWFLPSVAAGILAVAGAVALWLYFGR